MAVAAARLESEAECLHAHLMAGAIGSDNDHVLACIYACWLTGGGALPDWLGLAPPSFRRLLAFHFPAVDTATDGRIGRPLPAARCDEIDDLVALMWQHRADEAPTRRWMAELVAAACLGNDHLWQDLGLWHRGDLTALMQRNFPSLAALNTKDMKWKRFLYRQLCEREGIRICRSPSCEACDDFHACFGPEH